MFKKLLRLRRLRKTLEAIDSELKWYQDIVNSGVQVEDYVAQERLNLLKARARIREDYNEYKYNWMRRV